MMVPDNPDDYYKKRRAREEEIEQEEIEKKRKMGAMESAMAEEKVEELLERAEPLIAQVDNLYNQYLRGIERHPPHARRQLLDQTMSTLALMTKIGSTVQFKYDNLRSRYVSQKERWDKMIRDLESGKLKRATRPGGGKA